MLREVMMLSVARTGSPTRTRLPERRFWLGKAIMRLHLLLLAYQPLQPVPTLHCSFHRREWSFS